MAIETNPTGVGNVSSVQATKPVNTDPGIRKIGGESAGGSGFQPQTNVNLKNSMEDIAGLLSKVAQQDASADQTMPAEIQKMIQTVLKNAFSLESTLSQGLGSSMESQRFSMEQLNILARVFAQLGANAEATGSSSSLTESLQALLKNLKSFDGKNGKLLDTVQLNKMAFQLLDDYPAEEVPEALRFLMGEAPSPKEGAFSPAQAKQLTAFKQLMRYFMPEKQANTTNTATTANTGTKNMPQSPNTTTAQSGNSQKNSPQSANQASPEPSQAAAQSNSQKAAMKLPEQPAGAKAENPLSQKAAAEAELSGAKNSVLAESEAAEPGGRQAETKTLTGKEGSKEQPLAGKNQQELASGAEQKVWNPQNGQGEKLSPQKNETKLSQNMTNTEADADADGGNGATPDSLPGKNLPADGEKTRYLNQNSPDRSGTFLSKNTENSNTKTNLPGFSPPFENGGEATDTLKNLGQLLLKNNNLSEKEQQVLQNFVNGKQNFLSEQDAKQLQLLIRLSEKNIPASVLQAAKKENLPDLPKLWSFVQLCDLSELKDMDPQTLKSAGKNLQSLATEMRQSMPNENSTVENQRSMNFMMPIYMGENEKSYPTYVHVYDEKKKNNETGEESKETWLRFCILTENIGAVEIVFRLYEGNNLNVRVAFSDAAVVQSFKEYIPEFKEAMGKSSLELKDIKISAIGSKV